MDTLQPENETHEPASKRQKVAITTKKSRTDQCLHYLLDVVQKKTFENSADDSQSTREAAVGIHHYVNPSRIGFSGILKKRYTDFIVNEIALDGTVHHLTDDQAIQEDRFTISNKKNDAHSISPTCLPSVALSDTITTTVEPIPSTPSVSHKSKNASPNNKSNSNLHASSVSCVTPEEETNLISLFGEEKKNEIMHLHQKIISKPVAKPKEFGFVLTSPILDRQLRGQIHQALRRIFQGCFESSFDEVCKGIRITAASKATRQGPRDGVSNRSNEKHLKGKIGWDERGGEYLHMSLFKQDRDTMEVVSHMARILKVKPHVFSYAGTKDRRAVTTQRVSAYRITAESMTRINGSIYNATVGNFKYEKQPLELGELQGNLFTITLRECSFCEDALENSVERLERAQQVVNAACKSLATSGFINYFGLQRFGTFHIGTHTIGKLILQGNFAHAVASILMCSSDAWELAAREPGAWNFKKKIGKDEIARAKSIRGFVLGELSLEESLSTLPRRFNAERNILNHLKTPNGYDFLGALLSIPRNLRLMYVHAYQSFVWNEAVSKRWERYGNKVVAGDLVLVNSKAKSNLEPAQFDECGEVIIQPAAHDFSVARESIFERARPLSSDQAMSQKFSVLDIVLPLPGFDVEYPTNEIGEFYKTFMGSEQGGNLDPSNMRRNQKDFSLSGGYRKLMATINRIEAVAKVYDDENAQLVATDMDRLLEMRAGACIPNKSFIADAQPRNSNTVCNRSLLDGSDIPDSSTPQVKLLAAEPIQTIPLIDPTVSASVSNLLGILAGNKINIFPPNSTSSNPTLQSLPHSPTKRDDPRPLSTVQILGKSSSTTEVTLQGSISPAASTAVETYQETIPVNATVTASPSLSQSTSIIATEKAKIGVVLTFDLSLSQYATMLLRELMGADNVQHYQPGFGCRKDN